MQSRENRSRSINSASSDRGFSPPAWAALLPHSIVALGGGEQPIERLWALQSAVAKGVHLATTVWNLRLRRPFRAVLNVRFR
jgi:hypothetical protein